MTDWGKLKQTVYFYIFKPTRWHVPWSDACWPIWWRFFSVPCPVHLKNTQKGHLLIYHYSYRYYTKQGRGRDIFSHLLSFTHTAIIITNSSLLLRQFCTNYSWEMMEGSPSSLRTSGSHVDKTLFIYEHDLSHSLLQISVPCLTWMTSSWVNWGLLVLLTSVFLLAYFCFSLLPHYLTVWPVVHYS